MVSVEGVVLRHCVTSGVDKVGVDGEEGALWGVDPGI